MENIIKKTETNNSRVVLDNRSRISITGVVRVDSSNESAIILSLKDTKMTITGNDLHVSRLSIEEGVLEATGTVNSIKYGGSGVMKRIFK